MKLFNRIAHSSAARILERKYPKLYQWLLCRLSIKEFSGLPLSVLIIVFGFNLLLLAKITEDVFNSEAIIQLDKRMAEIIGLLQTPFLLKVFYIITQIGAPISNCSVFFATLFLLFKINRDSYVIGLCVSAIGAGISIFLGKNFVHRVRPDVFQYYRVSSYSFPSGHATISVALYGFLTYIFWDQVETKGKKKLCIYTGLLLVLSIGFSRLYLEVHFLSDILAGWSLGFLWLILGICIVEFKKRKRIGSG